MIILAVISMLEKHEEAIYRQIASSIHCLVIVPVRVSCPIM
jgi:hypothetical protein